MNILFRNIKDHHLWLIILILIMIGILFFGLVPKGFDFKNRVHWLSLEKQFLLPPWHQFRFNQGFLIDFFVNLLGFIPFGVALVIVMSNTDRISKRWLLVLTVLMAFLLSLMIEAIQAWMPSRSSNLHDLILNTIGGLLGAKVGMRIINRNKFITTGIIHLQY